MNHQEIKNWVLLLSLAIIWGSSFLFIKIAIATVPPLTIVAGRTFFSAVLLILLCIFMYLKYPKRKSFWIYCLVAAILGNCIPFSLISWGEEKVTSSMAGMLMSIMPLTTLMLSYLFLRNEVITKYKFIGFMLGFLGIVLLLSPNIQVSNNFLTDNILHKGAILLATVFYAITSIIAKKYDQKEPIVTSAIVMVFAMLVMAPLSLYFEQPWNIDFPKEALISIFMLGIGGSAVGTVIYFKLITDAGPTFFSLINYLIPIFALIFGISFLNEVVTSREILGLLIILVGMYLSRY